MALLSILVALSLTASSAAPAAVQDPGIFDLLQGAWTGSGTLLGRPAEFRMSWSRPLGGRFARLEFANAFAAQGSGAATPVLSAIGFYPLAGTAPRRGWWFDSRGATVSLAITPTDSALQVEWEGNGERGRTVYRIGADGVAVVDSVFAGDGFREFGRATYRRDQTSAVVATTGRFEFYSDPRVGLHHFLVAWAAADADAWPPYALYIAERGSWRAVLTDEEERAWAAAVDAYAATVGGSLTFDDALIAVRDWAAGVAPRQEIPAAARPLADAVEAALPIYRQHWWPAHDARNRAWIEAVTPVLAAIEEDAIPRLEAAYGGRWPDAPIPVDIVVYANDVGAYSTGGRVTISGADYGNGMPQAIEMVFHESSHIDPLDSSLSAAVDAAFQAAGGTAPERYWHDMIFYTTGEVTRLVLAEHGQPGYRHYGSFGLYGRRERWATELPALDAHWRPFLESGSADDVARRAALEAMAAQLLEGGENGSR